MSRCDTKQKKSWFRSPWTTFAGMILGALVGIYAKELVPYLSPLGKIYMSLLGMCVLPIILTAIISGLGRLLKSGESSRYLKRLVVVFTGGILAAAAVGLAAGLIGKPGSNLGEETRLVMGKIFLKAEVFSVEGQGGSPGLYQFLNDVVPSNVFFSLSQGQTLSVVLISIFLGCALGISNKSASITVLESFDVLYEAFLKIMGWILYLIPVGLFCFSAAQVAEVGPEIFVALAKFILIFYLASYALCFLYTLVIWRCTGLSLIESLSRLKEPLIVAFGTRSSVASIPLAIGALEKDLKVDKEISHLVVPLAVIMNRHSFPMGFALTAVLVAQLYVVSLGPGDLIFIAIVAALVGMAAAGPPTVVATMLAFVLNPIGLPIDAGIMLFAAAGPLIEPIITVVNVHASCATATLIAPPQKEAASEWAPDLSGREVEVSGAES